MALAGIVDVGLVYFIGRCLFGGELLGAAAALLLAATPAHLINSRIAMDSRRRCRSSSRGCSAWCRTCGEVPACCCLPRVRRSNKQLAELVGIAPSTALMRTRALSERGIVQGYEAKLSLSAIGRSVQALVAVRLRAHDRDQDRPLYRHACHTCPPSCQRSIPQVRADYLLHIAVGSTEDLRDGVLDNLGTDPVVGHTETTLVFEHIQGNHGPPARLVSYAVRVCRRRTRQKLGSRMDDLT